MGDDLRQTGTQDDERINIEQDHEVNYWAEKLGISRARLCEAVQAAGPMLKDVRRHLSH